MICFCLKIKLLNDWIFQNLSKYGGRNTVTLLTGDGVGPELLSHVQEVFR